MSECQCLSLGACQHDHVSDVPDHKDLLMVMNVRRIEECLRSYRQLPLDKLWIKNLFELDIERRWDDVMELTEGYDRLYIVSDDTIVPRHVYAELSRLMNQGYEVVTGYCNLSLEDFRLNIEKNPLPEQSTVEDRSFYTIEDAMAWPRDHMRTFLTGFSMLGMSRELWERFPFIADGGADFNLSKRLAGAGIPIWAATNGFCWHVKEVWNKGDAEPRKALLMGVEPAELVLEEARGWAGDAIDGV